MRVAARPYAGGSWAEIGRRSTHWILRRWPLLLGLAVLAIPTLLRLATISWSTEQGAHGPIIFITGLWLIWRARPWEVAERRSTLPGGLLLLPALILYSLGRITGILPLEAAALYSVLLCVLWLQAGAAALRRLWFPLIYLLFMITPPENWLFVATRPVKAAISSGAVNLLSLLGLPIGSTGTVIQIGGYQLLVATACSGINSLLGICALGLFYVYLRHGHAPRYALLLVALMVPLAIGANFVRVIILVLITYYVSEDVAQGVSHQLVGMGMFILALAMLLGLDAILYPIVTRWQRRAIHK
jgi:exosortase